jgi:serine/threonine protein phosphatase PrpC
MSGKNYSQATDVGLLRDNNEDAILSNPQAGLWLVADGMGGHAAGEVASEITRSTINQMVHEGKNLVDAINAAHEAVLDASRDGTGKYGMGSTVVALHTSGKIYQIAWVGDSRAYLWSDRDHDGYSLQQITVDHSYVQMLYESGIISAEEMLCHPEKNVITQCLGSVELTRLKVDMVEGKWHKSDWILLCSDGLTDTVSDQHICDLLHSAADPETAVTNLVQAALDNGGKDNISVIIVAPPTNLKLGLIDCLRTIGRWREKK